MTHPFSGFSILSASILLILFKKYDWRSPLLNLGILGMYIALLIIEFGFFGLPKTPLQISSGISKGTMFDLIMSLMPLLYFTMRTLATFWLVPVIWRSREMSKGV